MQTIFLRRPNIGSFLLRTGLWSSWSHCGIVLPDQTVIEAAAFHGVRQRPFAEVLTDSSASSLKTIEVPDDEAAYAFARAQIGKPYDWRGAIGLAFHREWEDDDKWFCSELIDAACVAGGRRRFVAQTKRITPQLAWMVA